MVESSPEVKELQEYLEDLQNLKTQAKTPKATSLLEGEIRKTQANIALQAAKVPQKVEKAELSKQEKEAEEEKKAGFDFSAIKFETISTWGWDHEAKKVKVFVSKGMEEIGSHDKSKIECEFTDNSFDLKIYDFKGKNWRLKVQPLNNVIKGEESGFRIKSNSISISLVKANDKIWSDLGPSRYNLKPEGKESKKDLDPQSSLMDMMKNLYEQGDDEMKRTIGESMAKARKDNPGFGM